MEKRELAGCYVGLTPNNISGGEMMTELTEAIQATAKKLQEKWNSSGRHGAAEVALKIKLSPSKDAEDHIRVSHTIVTKLPTSETVTLAKVAKTGDLMVQPSGSSADAPEQIQLAFDRQGALIGKVDTDGKHVAPLEPVGDGVVQKIG